MHKLLLNIILPIVLMPMLPSHNTDNLRMPVKPLVKPPFTVKPYGKSPYYNIPYSYCPSMTHIPDCRVVMCLSNKTEVYKGK